MIVKDTSHANSSYTLQAKLRPTIEQLCDDGILSCFSENYYWSTQGLTYEFDFYCKTHDGIPLDIECDYSDHHTYEKDMERDALVSDNGICTIRVSESKIYGNRAATFIKHEINRIRNSKKLKPRRKVIFFLSLKKLMVLFLAYVLRFQPMRNIIDMPPLLAL